MTTTRVTHASPAAAYAHAADRKWEADADLPTRGLKCEDIASQLVRGRVGSGLNVRIEAKQTLKLFLFDVICYP